MIELRDYQKNAIASLFDYLYKNPGKNPCVVAPTGGGKSLLIAEFCRYSIKAWTETRILILTHQKELIVQDARALKRIWEEADIGIYSASLGLKQLEQPIVYASIQSIYKVSARFDVVLIDEAHLVNNEEEGMYRKFIERLKPSVVIGFTATPYRLGQGMLTDEMSIFDDLIDVISIKELQQKGYLALLRSKATAVHYDISGVKTRGGDYVESELQEATSDYATNEAVCEEIARSARFYKRKHILVFCTGVEHAKTISGILNEKGMKSFYVTGSMSQEEREERINQFIAGAVDAICNVSILTTGFDYPNIDMIVLLRATLSAGLYLQMLGRGLRLKSDSNKDCLVLDFAENVMRHGPVTEVQPPSSRKKSDKLGVMPCKECPNCLEIVTMQTRVCPSCGFEFPRNQRVWQLFNGDVNGGGYNSYELYGWRWYMTTSRTSAKPMIAIEFLARTAQIREFILIGHDGFAYRNAIDKAKYYCTKFGIEFSKYYIKSDENGKRLYDWEAFMSEIADKPCPRIVITEKKGKFDNIVERLWDEDIEEIRKESDKLKEKADETRKAIMHI